MGSIYRREGSSKWWIRYRDADGKLIRTSARTTDEQSARQQLAAIEHELLMKAARERLERIAEPLASAPTSSLRAGSELEVLRSQIADRDREIARLRREHRREVKGIRQMYETRLTKLEDLIRETTSAIVAQKSHGEPQGDIP